MNYREEAYLMHYGVPGMKWGKRAGNAVRSYVRDVAKYTGNSFAHPLRTSIARAELTKKSSVSQVYRQNQLFLKGSELKQMNASIAAQKGKKMSGSKLVQSVLLNTATAVYSHAVTSTVASIGTKIAKAALGD